MGKKKELHNIYTWAMEQWLMCLSHHCKPAQPYSIFHVGQHLQLLIITAWQVINLEFGKETNSQKRAPVVWREGAVTGDAFNWAIVTQHNTTQHKYSEWVRVLLYTV